MGQIVITLARGCPQKRMTARHNGCILHDFKTNLDFQTAFSIILWIRLTTRNRLTSLEVDKDFLGVFLKGAHEMNEGMHDVWGSVGNFFLTYRIAIRHGERHLSL